MQKLPLTINLETIEIYKKISSANYSLGELNGLLNLLPNPNIILNAISLREAKDSSEIENIVTTYDKLFNSLGSNYKNNYDEKEVMQYKKAITVGFSELNEKKFMNTNSIINIQEVIEGSKTGIRKVPGTKIINPKSHEVVYVPPQSESDIRDYLQNLKQYMNHDTGNAALIDLAIIHSQFESIHPFYDANGRTGRIINILFLVLKDKLKYPVLYLSKYINDNKEEYYKILRLCNNDIIHIHDFVLYMLDAVEKTSKDTINFINMIVSDMSETERKVKNLNRNYYSFDLVDFLYSNFYITIELYSTKYDVSRQTASSHLTMMEEDGLLMKENRGRSIVYMNKQLIELMKNW